MKEAATVNSSYQGNNIIYVQFSQKYISYDSKWHLQILPILRKNVYSKIVLARFLFLLLISFEYTLKEIRELELDIIATNHFCLREEDFKNKTAFFFWKQIFYLRQNQNLPGHLQLI